MFGSFGNKTNQTFGTSASPFGVQQQQNNAATATASNFNSPFGSNTVSNTGNSLFGNTNNLAGNSGFGQSGTGTTNPLFSSGTQNMSGAMSSGTNVKPFTAHQEKDPTTNAINVFQSISCMPEYKNFSFEELRMQDYQANRKFSTNQGAPPTLGNTNQLGALSSTTGSFGNTFGGNSQTSAGGLSNQQKPTSFGNNSLAFGGGANQNTFGNTTSSMNSPFAPKPASTGGLFGQTNNASPFGQQQNNTGFGAPTTGSGAFGTANTFPQGGSSTGGLFGNKPTAGSLFGNQGAQQPSNAFGSSGGSLFGQNNQQANTSNSLFGQNNQQNTTSGGLFGQTNQQQQNAGAFGQNNNNTFGNQQQTTGMFGNRPTSGGLFGQTATTQSQGGSLFGQSNQRSSAGGLFGQNNQQQQNTGLFGQNNQQNNTTTGGLFGNKAPTTTGLFGQNTSQQQQPGGGLFGAQQQAPTGGLFGQGNQQQQPQVGGLFGQQQQPNAGGGLFGSNPTTTTTTNGGLFGTNNNTTNTGLNVGFGANTTANTQTTFGSNTGAGLFGNKTAPAPSATGGLFGSSNKPAAAPGGGLFGNTNAAPDSTGISGGGLFGSKPSTFAGNPSIGGGLFGSKPAVSTLGGSSGNNTFGTTLNTTKPSMILGQNNQQQLQQNGLQPNIVNNNPYGTEGVFAKINPATRGNNATSQISVVKIGADMKKKTSLSGAYKLAPKPLFSSKQSSLTNNFQEKSGNSILSSAQNNKQVESKPLLLGVSSKSNTASIANASEVDSSILSSDSLLFNPDKKSFKNLIMHRKLLETEASIESTIATTTKQNYPDENVKNEEAAIDDKEKTSRSLDLSSRNTTEVSNKECKIKEKESNTLNPVDRDLSFIDENYFISPSFETLSSQTLLELRKVNDLVVGHKLFGKIEFLEPVDLSSISLSSLGGQLIEFESKSFELYPNEIEKPSPGEGLNVRARVTCYNCFPVDKATREPIKDANHQLVKRHINKLKKVPNSKFEKYDTETGAYTFIINNTV
ncbi:hypothetical protein KAFR_0B05250 [Kazachstania africana CBS 2517]|uniref:Peptidase S59 domain-containing protein n=1 Tax=Kazachstania africana (strain ATCC 22294 / BCRC 22015 / CBS 2517 / CECT 1963 / NBRC 1671 / NRRL Y-8276) TaxID=1071382 RepID=H2AR21_KAZAF|nr:hypothetical protein KAFR_0B05250 [Kazachstania africana CBS 2517]CCF56821.1 hypothetical protein KAFR_0B05250 [Kazachstania africana CBS 2517]